MPSDAITVIHVDAGHQRTTYLSLKKVFGDVSGEVRICDPYYGKGSLLRLDLLEHCSPIRFLTQQPGGNEKTTIVSEMEEWSREHGSIEFRRRIGHDLHDRFVLSNAELILIGHGLKDIGGKDSFVVRIDSSLAQEVISSVRESFDKRWSTAEPLA